MLADLFELPQAADVGLRCTNLRDMNGKRPIFVDDANSMFTQLLEEIHHLYLLGFVPKALDGEYHRLKVTVNDKSMLVRARGMYHAAPPDRPNGGDTKRR